MHCDNEWLHWERWRSIPLGAKIMVTIMMTGVDDYDDGDAGNCNGDDDDDTLSMAITTLCCDEDEDDNTDDGGHGDADDTGDLISDVELGKDSDDTEPVSRLHSICSPACEKTGLYPMTVVAKIQPSAPPWPEHRHRSLPVR